jgi:hypothetical protein
MVKNINVKLATMIEEYIISVPFLKSKFTHHNIKYSIGKLIDNIIIILKTGISYRDIQKYTKIHWNTIYKFKLKLVKYNIFEKLFNKTINTYITEIGNTSKLYYSFFQKHIVSFRNIYIRTLFLLYALRAIQIQHLFVIN